MLVLRNAADQPVPPTTLPALVERQVRRTPRAPALVFEGTTLSYAELNARANRLARRLVADGAGPEDVVALDLPRSLELVVAILAVLKAGACYLPLDPDYPADRRELMVEFARPVRVLRPEDVADSRSREYADGDLTDAERTTPLLPDHRAYVIFTSGSTGVPKGVIGTHRAIGNRLACMIGELPLLPDDRVLQKSPSSFDPSVCEIFWPLAQGATVVLARPVDHRDPAYLASLIRREHVTTVVFVASMIPLFVEAYATGDGDPGPLRRIFNTGEALKVSVADQFRTAVGAALYNDYGPTEAAVGVAFWQSRPLTDTAVSPIGRAVWNTELLLLDDRLCPVAEGETGELYIAGVQLARGYINQPGLTAQRFLANPFGPPGTRMYRTGDLAFRRADGELEFAGRVDDQIKIRGHRIEPAEIEAVIARHPGVSHVAVVVRDSPAGEARMIAYVVPAGGGAGGGGAVGDGGVGGGGGADDPLSSDRLREHCAATLPGYMVPAAFVRLESLPLTPSGKLNRRALPDPVLTRTVSGRTARTGDEKILCDLFSELLGVRPVGIDEDFFALGGHSLAAARLVSRLRATTGVELDVRAVFEAPTVVALAARLAVTGATARPALLPAEPAERPELSFAQRRLWFIQQFEGATATYNVPVATRLRGPLDHDALREALDDVIGRQEALRTVFPVVDGEPYQRVLPAGEVRADLTVVPCEEPDLAAALRAAAGRPFALDAAIPLRAHLFAVGPREHVLLLTIHHIATDGWSQGPLLRDLAAAYEARRDRRAPTRPALPVRYTDYARWQHGTLGDLKDPASAGGRQLAYWRSALAGLPEELRLPTDRPRPTDPGGGGGAVPVGLDATLHTAITGLARSANATLYMTLQAALAALLCRLGAGTDIPLGAITAGRADPALDDMVGFFANTLVLRTDLSGDPTFRELLARVRETDLAAFAHQDLPFERLVEELNPGRSAARHPLFQTMFVLQDDTADLDFAGLPGEDLPVEVGAAKFDLTLDVGETHHEDGSPAGIRGVLRYATDLYEHSTAAALADRFDRILRAAVADPDRRVGELDLLTPAERADLTALAQPSGGRVAHDLSVHGLFEEQARRTPDAIALLDGDLTIGYARLDEQAERLAQALTAAGVRRGDVVGVHVERGARMVACLLGVLKAGAAYTMLDIDFPTERLRAVLDRVGARTVIGHGAGSTPLGRPGLGILDLDTMEADATPASSRGPRVPVGADDLACVMFTSGSTGEPKGVLAPHRALVGSLHEQGYAGFGPGERYLQTAPVSWDAFARQVFGPLLAGGTCVPQPGQRPDPQRIADLVARHGITVLDTAGSLFTHLWDEYPQVFAGLRWALTGGEPASPAHLSAIRDRHPALRIVNGYGPVESMGYSTAFRADAGWNGSRVPVGSPVATKSALVLDDRLALVPDGVPGELYLAGEGLARGYAGRPGLTAERFVANPYGRPGERMYRTGDLVRRTADGELDCLGRGDDQVKVRGFRIEPEEIRTVLAGHPAVRQAEVVIREDRPGDKRVVAYLVVDQERLPDPGIELRAHAAARLPEYLVPQAYVVLAELPRTANGKLDRRALPAPDLTAVSTGRAPRTPQEEQLCELFAELLGLTSVSIDDDFFALGGHSLLVMRMISRIKTAFKVEVSIKTVFAAPTVAALVEQLAFARKARPALRARTKESL